MVDLGIIILIILGAFIGMKRGFIKELVNAVGFIVCVIFAFFLKNPIASVMYDTLPFFSFGGILKGVTALNILVYEVIAFLLTLSILLVILRLVKVATGLFEKILNATIILGVPSKILGAIVGGIEWLIISFIVLFVLSLPIFNNKYVYNSFIYDKMYAMTPYFSKQINETMTVFKEFEELKNKYAEKGDVNQFNLDSLDLLLKYHIIDAESANKLYEKGKFKTIKNIESVLDKYREEN
ncbi:MAG: CvpA family protein [Bacilli bacterium]|nr:CvpA family protein [Bacilli bacterium]